MEDKKTNLEENKVKELSNDELEKVTGGNFDLEFFDRKEDVRFIFYVNDIVWVREFIIKRQCRIVRCEVFEDPQFHTFEDAYVVRAIDGSDYYTRVLRDDIVNNGDD